MILVGCYQIGIGVIVAMLSSGLGMIAAIVYTKRHTSPETKDKVKAIEAKTERLAGNARRQRESLEVVSELHRRARDV